MPLVHNTVYTIHNDLTRTVLDFAPKLANHSVFARGWGLHGRQNQQWKAIKVSQGGWKFQNQGVPGDTTGLEAVQRRRFLSAANFANNNRLCGVTSPADVATFVVTPMIGPSGGCRISCGGFAVTLVLGADVIPEIIAANRAFDLQADGAPIALLTEAVPTDPENNKRAQIWSFVPVAQQPQQPIQNGIYKIMNSQTGTILGLANNDAIQGRISGDHQWTVTKVQDRDCYELKVGARFLGLGPAPQDGEVEPVAADETHLHGRADAQKKFFTIRRAPNTQYYKIFLAPANDNLDGVNRLAVNLALLDDGPAQPHGLRNPNPNDGTGVTLNETNVDQTQTWAFI